MKILIACKTSQLGSALSQQLHTDHEVKIKDRHELNISDEKSVKK